MNAYAYSAALYCEDCALALQERIGKDKDNGDSNAYPQGPYSNGGGEADSFQHCDGCKVFLDNPLTEDGIEHAIGALERYLVTGLGDARLYDAWSSALLLRYLEPDQETVAQLAFRKTQFELQ